MPGGLNPTAAAAAGVALVPGNRQRGSAVFPFSVRENVTLPALARYRSRLRVSTRREADATAMWIDRLDVQPPDPNRQLSALSGGNQQKVIIGKWLNAEPVVLLFDEPTAGVDIGAREAIYTLLRDRANEGLGVIVSSSDVQDLVALCHRVVAFREGEIVTELRGAQITEEALLHSMMGDATAQATGEHTTKNVIADTKEAS
jgi:ribose transport system ATP-binding protein